MDGKCAPGRTEPDYRQAERESGSPGANRLYSPVINKAILTPRSTEPKKCSCGFPMRWSSYDPVEGATFYRCSRCGELLKVPDPSWGDEIRYRELEHRPGNEGQIRGCG